MCSQASGPVFNNDEDFRYYLENELDLNIKLIISQGNCVYAAIAYHVYGNEDHWAEVREDVATEITVNREKYEWALADGETMTERMKQILNPGEWGGYLEISAAANRYKVNIIVYQAAGNYPTFPDDMRFFRTIRLSYHNHEHYNALTINDTKKNK